MSKIKILAISGSLKSTSTNTGILRFMSGFNPGTVDFRLFEELEDIPPFNPEKEEGTRSVANFKHALKEADGVIICTPEYAFGLPGVLKNALDWTVSSGEFNEKPVVAISASPLYSGGINALNSLLLTLTALGTKTNEHASLSIKDILNKLNAAKEISDEETISALKSVFNTLIKMIESKVIIN